jgi:hypothetical protein
MEAELSAQAAEFSKTFALSEMLSRKVYRVMRHSVGADSKHPGYRNRFFARRGSDDHAILRELERIGFASEVSASDGGSLIRYSITRSGCMFIGLKPEHIDRAMEE